MKTKKIIFIFVAANYFYALDLYGAQRSETLAVTQQDIQNHETVLCDELDELSNDTNFSHFTPTQQVQQSQAMIAIKKVGVAIILKLLAVKVYLSSQWESLKQWLGFQGVTGGAAHN